MASSCGNMVHGLGAIRSPAKRPDADCSLWKKADAQLVVLLWHSIDPTLMVYFYNYNTCHAIWTKARDLYSNDVQCLYDAIHNLSTLSMIDNLPSYCSRVQSAIGALKTLIISDDQKIRKLDNVCMVYVLHDLHKEFEFVHNQILMNPSVSTSEEFMGRLLRIPFQETISGIGSSTGGESSNLVARRGGRGQGRDSYTGRESACSGGGGHPQCSYCKRMGHTKDTCYNLIGSLDKSAAVAYSQSLESEQLETKTQQNIFFRCLI